MAEVLHAALDTTDVRRLAEFYRQLLGLVYRPGDEGDSAADWLVLTWPDGRRARNGSAAISTTRQQPNETQQHPTYGPYDIRHTKRLVRRKRGRGRMGG